MAIDLRKKAAKEFAAYWENKGYEKGESQSFWLSLLQNVFGVEHPEQYIQFEEQVKMDHTSFIDGHIKETKVLIEQKSKDKDLNKAIKQSDGSYLNPFQQAKRYILELPVSQHPRWVVTCNFKEFYVYDMENPQGEPEIIQLKDLDKEYYRLDFLIRKENYHLKKEMEVSIKAGEIVGLIYDAFSKQYKDLKNEKSLQSLNKLCVRIVFCLYAEDAGLFGEKGMFHDYLSLFDEKNMRRALIDLFKVLDTPINQRDPYLDEELANFPYVNGGLFADEDIEIPTISENIRNLLLSKASDDFDWSQISPTIFGAVFESTLNPETRRSGGMHYTSIENIHKVIDPLFLDDFKEELDKIKQIQSFNTRKKKLNEYRTKLSNVKFLDPASGSGNFLTESYISLRRLENEAIKLSEKHEQAQLGFKDELNPIKVSIQQFYGIEVNDFAVSVAKTALWIAESQMMKETEEIVKMDLDFLPLKSYVNIIENNALRMDWNELIDSDELNYIMGNPPFVGLSLRNKEQQKDMDIVFSDNSKAGRLDYVAAWYKKAAQYIKNTKIECSFVSTNSIIQGEQAPILWQDLFENHNITINFAYRPFPWNSESLNKASVHCVIIGFASFEKNKKILFENGKYRYVSYINGYLIEGEKIFIQLRGKAPKKLPKLTQGNKPWDGGFLILNEQERANLIKKYPEANEFIKLFIGSNEFIKDKKRYCLWLEGVSPSKYRHIPEIIERLKNVAEVRSKTKTEAVQKQAATPMLFSQIRQPKSDYIFVPETSSENRKYIPIGFLSKDVIASNSALVGENASIYHFGILTSNVHMAWMRTVAGRLESRYRYSPSVYNNFPWPELSEKQKQKIEATATKILNVRKLYSDCSLADLYDELTMPVDLRIAHQENDRAVMEAYGFFKKVDGKNTWLSESETVAELFKMYQKKVGEEN